MKFPKKLLFGFALVFVGGTAFGWKLRGSPRVEMLRTAAHDKLCEYRSCLYVEEFETLCGLFSEAEYATHESAEARGRWVRDEAAKTVRGKKLLELFDHALAQPPAERYEALRRAAVNHGAVDWGCPSMRRVFPSGGAPTELGTTTSTDA